MQVSPHSRSPKNTLPFRSRNALRTSTLQPQQDTAVSPASLGLGEGWSHHEHIPSIVQVAYNQLLFAAIMDSSDDTAASDNSKLTLDLCFHKDRSKRGRRIEAKVCIHSMRIGWLVKTVLLSVYLLIESLNSILPAMIIMKRNTIIALGCVP